MTEPISAPGEALALLIPLAAPALAYAVRAALKLVNTNRKAEIEDEVDSREYLQQQNELLLHKLLDRADDTKAQ